MKKETPQERYRKKYIKQIKFEVNVNTDQDIIEYLDKCKNKQGLIKELIRKEIKNKQMEE